MYHNLTRISVICKFLHNHYFCDHMHVPRPICWPQSEQSDVLAYYTKKKHLHLNTTANPR